MTISKRINSKIGFEINEKAVSLRLIMAPLDPQRIVSSISAPNLQILSDDVVEFLESRTEFLEFDYLGYEVKTVDYVSNLYLMINPDPLNFAYVRENSLVICHHKISPHNNGIYTKMLDHAKKSLFNIYNFHLGWDTMEGGIMDSFLFDFGLLNHEYEKVDLMYRGHRIPQLGAIFKRKFSLDEITRRLSLMNVRSSVIINPQCHTFKVGYIPGGGFVDNMVIEMAEMGVDVLISSDHNWVVETVARELGMTLVEIDHYHSERHGLFTLKKLLENSFIGTPVSILENVEGMQRAPCDC
ncbi:MAG: Nif3-like dinuclear metal center hexameric protein [Candidatus Thorarchaeota archaeon]|jgi:putative NIF3 family GTP cyclohydrolase 1 type 2